MARPRLLGIVMAGGKGERLYPLTRERSKPSVPFGARYRIVDFVLSNLTNSGVYSVYVLVQYKAQSLIEHVRSAWRVGGRIKDHFVTVVPPQMRWGESWYQGTADAVYQNLNLIEDFHPDLVAIFGADHIYRMDINQMVAHHLDRRADATVAALPVPIQEAGGFGIIESDQTGRIAGFQEKPAQPTPMPTDPTRAYSSMGNYLFNRELLVDALVEDARQGGEHDFGKTILPELCRSAHITAYNFLDNRVPGIQPYEEPGYWRDVGNIAAYWRAHMDLLGPTPPLDLRNHQWPILGDTYEGPSARIIDGTVRDSILGAGTVIHGSRVTRSILGRGVTVHADAEVEESIVMDFTEVGKGCRLRRTIVDRYNTLQPGAEIGFDRRQDALSYKVDASGIVVVPRGQTHWPSKRE
ncbi:MAG TPA: glucose-1-phosphate adenylyltransferase [Nitrospiria bacterium]|nr:glucose-1-phosphate adenylyltransferase [Nitrospiria bacterium]